MKNSAFDPIFISNLSWWNKQINHKIILSQYETTYSLSKLLFNVGMLDEQIMMIMRKK